MRVPWKTHRDGIWPMDIADVPGHQITATQYERRLSYSNPFKRQRYWCWSIVNTSGRKVAAGNAPNRKEARKAASQALTTLAAPLSKL